MSRSKKVIKPVVILPVGQDMEEFQKTVDKIYIEMVKNQLKKSNCEIEKQKSS